MRQWIVQLSSRYVKQDIVQVGRLGPVGVYEYSYVGDDRARRHTGFMAHEVKEYVPEAVCAIGGIDYVNYQRAVEELRV